MEHRIGGQPTKTGRGRLRATRSTHTGRSKASVPLHAMRVRVPLRSGSGSEGRPPTADRKLAARSQVELELLQIKPGFLHFQGAFTFLKTSIGCFLTKQRWS